MAERSQVEESDSTWRGAISGGGVEIASPSFTRLARVVARFHSPHPALLASPGPRPDFRQSRRLASPGRLQGSTCQCLSRARVAARQGFTRLARGSLALAKILFLLVLLTRRDCTLQ